VYPPRIACFVCGAEGPADYPLFLSPHGTTAGLKSLPHFPFLRQHAPPLGCRSPGPEGVAASCRVCYSSLLTQWEELERGGVALEKRVYWVRRVDGLSVMTSEQQLGVNKGVVSAAPLYTSISMAAPSTSAVMSRPLEGGHPWQISREMRPPSLPPHHPSHPELPDENDSALDLSSGPRDRETMKSRSSGISHASATSHHSSYMSEGAGSSTDILDLTLPDKNSATEVCYVCGEEFQKSSMSYVQTRAAANHRHFPSLIYHSRPPRSRPMDSAGRVHSCEDCSQHLLAQFDKFEEKSVTHADRNYTLRKRQTPVVDTTTFVCYICALDYHSTSLRLLYCRNNGENEPYYPMVEQQKPPPGASPISSGGMVQVCSHCYKCTREKYTGFLSSGPEPPPKKRKSSRPPSVPEVIGDLDQLDDEDKLSPADIACPLCQRKFTIHSFKYLHSQGPPLGGLPYFPFLKDLPRLNDESGVEDDSQGRVRACQTCTTSLINQWTTFQRETIPVEDRNYYYQSLAGPQSSGRLTPGDGGTRRATATPTSGRSLHSPGTSAQNSKSQPTSDNVRPRSNTAHISDKLVVDPNKTGDPPRSLEPRPRSNSNPHSPRVPTCHSPISVQSDPQHKTSTSSFYCFLCGLHSELSFARMLYSLPQGKKAPYFPFMRDHVPKPRAETLREDGTALVCTFCYHTVMTQWSRYQEARSPVSPHQRKYNINDYVCYVCGITTYRKRIRALRVMNLKRAQESAAAGNSQDFPFLRQHKTANMKGVITMENGDMAAVCLDCFESMRNQFTEAKVLEAFFGKSRFVEPQCIQID